MTQEAFAVLFDLEGQLDCTLHATEASAKIEYERLRKKYAAERANYSANVQMMRVTVPEFVPPVKAEAWSRAPHRNYWPNAICDGPQVLAIVLGTGYPTGDGWSPESERVAQMTVAAPAMLAALQALIANNYGQPRAVNVPALDPARAAVALATTPIWGPLGCVHDWQPDGTRSGGCVGLVCSRCGATDEKDVS